MSHAAPKGYDPVTKILHWLVFLSVAAQYAVGEFMPHIGRKSLDVGLVAVHIWLGALVFELPGAVIHKDKDAPSTKVTRFEAIALSICYFLPVEFPLEDQWVAATTSITYHMPFTGKPIKLRPAAIANFVLRMSGWIVVPLALAAVTGMLKVSN